MGSYQFALTAGLVGFASSAALAGGLGDIGLLIQDGQLVTAIGDDDTLSFEDFGARVFGSDELQGNWEGSGLVGIDDPGVLITDESNINVGSLVTMTITSSLRVWNGMDFDTNAAESMEFDFLGGTTSTNGSPVDAMTTLYNGGAFDEHPEYFLIGAGDPGSPAAGVYLYTFTMSVDSMTTETLFGVFGFGASEADFDAAFEYVEDVLVPAPGAAGVLALAGIAAARRRR